jgi:hypothetical protein
MHRPRTGPYNIAKAAAARVVGNTGTPGGCFIPSEGTFVERQVLSCLLRTDGYSRGNFEGLPCNRTGFARDDGWRQDGDAHKQPRASAVYRLQEQKLRDEVMPPHSLPHKRGGRKCKSPDREPNSVCLDLQCVKDLRMGC